MIVKVQVSQFTNASNPQMLIYNEDRSIVFEGDLTEEIKLCMQGEAKRFFHAKKRGTKIQINEIAAWQKW